MYDEEGSKRRRSSGAPALVMSTIVSVKQARVTEEEMKLLSREQKRAKFSLAAGLPSEEELARRRQEQISKGLRQMESEEERRARSRQTQSSIMPPASLPANGCEGRNIHVQIVSDTC